MALCVLYPLPADGGLEPFRGLRCGWDGQLQTAVFSTVVAVLSCISPWGNSILFYFLTVPQMVSWQPCTVKRENKIKY